jgi:PAS domain S-box-containing protein
MARTKKSNLVRNGADTSGQLVFSELRFRQMADNAPVMIWISGSDKLCTWFNKPWLDFTGRTLAQEQGNGWSEGVHADDFDRCLGTYVTAFDARQPFTMDYRLRRHDGEYRWILDNGIPLYDPGGAFAGYIGSCIDITDRKRAEEATAAAYEEIKRLKDRLQADNVYLQEEIKLRHSYGEIIGQSRGIQEVLVLVEQVAGTGAAVLLLGETGTGKELLARAIHDRSLRCGRPMVTLNCAALPPTLVESELFGHEKGAYTGAVTRQIGRFELADGSTLFLDEVGELPPEVQAKLLRVLQEGEFERLGSTKTLKADVRIIAASNRDLDHSVREGRFRQDLYYRLNVFPIRLPPLRERREDIPLLIRAFVKEFGRTLGKAVDSIPRLTLEALEQYPWPGNIRELRNVVERAMILSQGPTLSVELPRLPEPEAGQSDSSNLTLKEVERRHILSVLERTRWRVSGKRGAAAILGFKPTTLEYRMTKLGIARRH